MNKLNYLAGEAKSTSAGYIFYFFHKVKDNFNCNCDSLGQNHLFISLVEAKGAGDEDAVSEDKTEQ